MPKYKYILFDNDGTIVDTIPVIVKGFVKTMHDVMGDDNPDIELYKSTIGLPTEVQMNSFSDDPEMVKKLSETYRGYSQKYLDTMIENYEGLPEVLDKLKQAGNNLGIVTSKIHELTIKGLKQLNIEQYFDYVQGADDWPVHKPDPGAISHALDVLGLNTNEAIYIGDAPFDLIAANGAGVDTCAVTWGAHNAERLKPKNPTYLIDKPQQLLDIL